MEFRVLGPLEVVGEQGVLALTAPKQRAIVAALLVQANRVVPFDRLAEALWGDHPPSQASGALQVYVSNLRRVLEQDRAPRSRARVLVSVPPGYMLVVAPDRYDATRFEAGLEHGQALLSQGRADLAREALENALALWRGEAFGEFAGEPFAEAEANRLAELRIVATEVRLDCDLAMGRHATAAAELERLVSEHPLRERLWGSLMVALYRDGRQADALRAYQRCREVLGEELGLDPGPRLRELEHAILTQSDSEPLVLRPALATVNVTGPPASRPAVGTPSDAPSAATGGRLVGREGPLSVLGAAWQEVEAGRGGVVLVTGEPGIGKTSLVEHFSRQATARGAAVAWGSCFSGTAAPAFWPWIQVLRSIVGAREPAELGAELSRAGLDRMDFAPLLPEWSNADAVPPQSPVTPAAARSRLFESITAFASVVTVGRPTVLVLDDLHWADVDSLQLLEFIAPHLAGLRLLVVGTYRDDEVEATHPLAATLAALARLPSLRRVPLPRLTAGEVATFLGVATGTDPTAAFVAAMHVRTDGNPFFLVELVRLLEAEGGPLDPAAVERSPVPVGIRDVIRRRLARLPEQTNALLAIAAVAGDEFDLDVLEVVSGLDEGALDAVEVALLTGIVLENAERPGRFRFSHALIRQTLHDGMSGVRRARLHARVGEALESRIEPPAAAELADHFRQAAAVVGPEKGYAYALQASRDAETALAFDVAEDHLRRALDLAAMMPAGPGRDRKELDAVVALGVLATMTRWWADGQLAGIWARARELCERTGDATRLFGSLWGLYWVAQTAADGAGTDRLAPELMTLAEAHGDAGLLFGAHYAAGSVAFFRGDLRSAEANYQRAADLVDEVGAEALAVYPIHPVALGPTMLAPTRWLLGHPDSAWALLTGSVRRAETIDQPFTTLAVLVSLMFVAVADGRADTVKDTSAQLFEVATEYGFAQFVTLARVYLDWAQAHADDPADGVAVRMRRNLAELWASGWRVMRDFELGMLAEAQRRAGDMPAALASIDDGLALVDTTGWHFWDAELHRLRGELLATNPATAEEAHRSLHRAVDVATRQGAAMLLERARASLERLTGESR
ncbi:MAG TPA: BTAD domain-containing putative transcriptional regulator [Pilimelia sp.]|nr:BTAD domain-containing putative transcriptional regulator [Pilimelia sp.]